MARSRNIKPAFFQNEELADLQPIERLAFIAMWTIADYRGCIEYRPKRLKIQLLPYDNCSIESIVTNLEQSRFIMTYSVQGQTYIKITNFEKHQNPHPNERKAGSTIPDVNEKDNTNSDLQNIVTNHDKDGTNRADSLIPLTDSLLPIEGAQKETQPKDIRGSRLSNDWQAPQEYISFCNTERPDLDANMIANMFKDYWIGVAGAKGNKNDWFATWRNWVRRQEQGKSKFKNKSAIISDSQFDDWLNSTTSEVQHERLA